MVGVAEGGNGNTPGRLELHAVIVDQQAQQLGDGDGRMRVVQLDGGVVGQSLERAEFAQVTRHQILQGGRREEELLPQPQLLSGFGIIAGIEHAADRFGTYPVAQSAHVVAAVELVQMQRFGGACGPQAQRVGVIAARTDHRRVVRHR